MTSPDEDTRTDSVRDMAKEQRKAMGSRGSIRLGRFRAPVVFVVLLLTALGGGPLALCRAGLVGGLQCGAEPAGAAFGSGTGFSKASVPRVGGADSARAMGAGFGWRGGGGGGGGGLVVECAAAAAMAEDVAKVVVMVFCVYSN